MKLHPEDIEVVSFPTDELAGKSYPVTTDPLHPTPATYCFVCD